MEQKRLFVVGVLGEIPRENVPTDVVLVPVSKEAGAFVFGIQKRSEDDPERALRLALKLTSEDNRIVITEIFVAAGKEKPSLPWNEELAPQFKRLQPGDISISHPIALLFERLFLIEHVQVSGTKLHLLRGERRRPLRVRGLTPSYGKLIGRQKELERIDELVTQVHEDQGQVVGVIGAPGIGKTRFIAEFKENLTKHDVPFFEGTYRIHESDPYQAFRQIVQTLSDARGPRLENLGLTIGEFDYIDYLTHPGKAPETLSGLSEDDLRKGLFYAARKLIHHVAKKPLVLIFEDLHWADPQSFELLEYVMEGVEGTRLLMVLIHRPDIAKPWDRRLNYTELVLQPFHPMEVGELVQDVLSVNRVARTTLERLSTLSRGNPLFVEEVLRHLLDANALEIQTTEDGSKYLTEGASKAELVPTAVHALIASRFDGLHPDVQCVLRWASLLGSVVNMEELKAFLQELPHPSIDESIKATFEKGYLSEKSVFPRNEIQFIHDLIFEVVRDNVAGKERQRMQAQIGRFLERFHAGSMDVVVRERIATHFLEGDDAKLAVETAVKAGEILTSLCRFSVAERFFSAALKCWKDNNVKEIPSHAVYKPLINVLLEVADLESTEKTIEEWKKHGVDQDLHVKADFWTLQMRLKQTQRKYEDAIKASELALQTFDTLGDQSEKRFGVIKDLVWCLHSVARADDAAREARNAIRELGDQFPEVRIGLLGYLGIHAAYNGAPAVALDYVSKARTLVSPTLSPMLQARHARRISGIYQYLRMNTEERRALTEAIEISRGAGMREFYIESVGVRGAAANDWGDFILSFRDLEEVLKEAREMKSLGVAEHALLCIVDNLIDLGAIDEARNKWVEFKKEFPEPADLRQRGRRFSVDATLSECIEDYVSAIRYRGEAAKIFGQLGDLAYEGRARFQKLKAEAKGATRPIGAIVLDFNNLASEVENIQAPITHYARRETAYILAARGEKPDPGPESDYDTLDCRVSYYMQYLTVAKIQWLDKVQKTKEADELRKSYRAVRLRMMEKIPTQYRATFEKHVLYRVPEGSKN